MEALLFCTLPRCLPWNDGGIYCLMQLRQDKRERPAVLPPSTTRRGWTTKPSAGCRRGHHRGGGDGRQPTGLRQAAAAAAGLDWCLVLDQQLTGAKQQKCIMTVEEFCARGKALVAWRSGRRPETAARRRRQRRPPQCWPRSTRSSAPCSTSQDLPAPACAGLGRAGPAIMANRGPPVPCHVCATHTSLHQPPP